MKDFLNHPFWDSRIHSDTITKKERMLGYFFGPVSVISMVQCTDFRDIPAFLHALNVIISHGVSRLW